MKLFGVPVVISPAVSADVMFHMATAKQIGTAFMDGRVVVEDRSPPPPERLQGEG